MGEGEKLNLQQKLRKIGEMAGALQKTKDGFGYKYVPESEVLNVVSAGFNKWLVNCVPEIVENTMTITPISYTKVDKKGVEKPVHETLVNGIIKYTFYDAESSESLTVPWAFVANMEDGAQAFGAALTYANRYFFCKFFQIATVEDDPDEYRKKQKENENYEENKKLDELKSAIIKTATLAIGKGIERSAVTDIIAKHNDGKQNPSTIVEIPVAEAVLKAVEELANSASAPEKKSAAAKKEKTAAKAEE